MTDSSKPPPGRGSWTVPRGRPRNVNSRLRELDQMETVFVRIVAIETTRVKLVRDGTRDPEWFAWGHLATTRSELVDAIESDAMAATPVSIAIWKLKGVGWNR